MGELWREIWTPIRSKFYKEHVPYSSRHLANTALCNIRETWNPEPAFESGEGLFQSRGMPQRQALILARGLVAPL